MRSPEWRPLRSAHRAGLPPKLARLAQADRAGLRVPPTVWAPASLAPGLAAPRELGPPPWICRSAAPDEDGARTSAAGRYKSREVFREEDLAVALAEVVDSLPRDADGAPRGAVMVQPLLSPERAGIAFFDGFHYELTTAPKSNRALTDGSARGDVRRGHLARGEAWSAWLERVHATFGRELGRGALDIELAADGEDYTLLQVRPALFRVHRNPTLSLANHREILGDPPSPWIASALERAGRDALAWFAGVDGAIARWNEPYAVVLGGRAWLNLAFFFRLMDRWGLPRTMVTEGVGGEAAGPLDGRLLWGRFLRAGPRLLALQARNALTVLGARRDLRRLARRIAGARDLVALFDATAAALALALRINFAINGALSGIVRVRRALGITGRARVVTEAMMEDFDALRRLPAEARAAGLAGWLARYGHRGPLESDPARPRFAELAELLRAELDGAPDAPDAPDAAGAPPPVRASRGLPNPLFWLDRRRESFRDELMHLFVPLRRALLDAGRRLVAAGELERAEDVFLLSGDELARRPLAPVVRRNRALLEDLRHVPLPTTADREAIERALANAAPEPVDDRRVFAGVALTPAGFTGRALKAVDLEPLLASLARGEARLDPRTVLIVPALEPSWAVLFPRVGAVVTDLGGELSHASILLREAGKPAVVNCRGVFAAVRDGDAVRLEGSRVHLVDAPHGRERTRGREAPSPSSSSPEDPRRART